MRIRQRMCHQALRDPSRHKPCQAASCRGCRRGRFGAGEPDFATPDFIVEAMVEAARSGATRYLPVAGLPALRQAVAESFSGLYGQPFSADEVLVSCGGKHSLFNLFQVLVDPGDKVINPSTFTVE